MAQNSIVQNRSKLKDFLASIATIRGDLSNTTAPPFVLDTKSTVELPAFWADRPSIFVAAASQEDPKLRALYVLRWFLYSLRNQQYAGRTEEAGVKKPLNAFLGEIYLAQWDEEKEVTRIVSEQVSHHPPITACRVWNDQHGIMAEGFTQQEVTFTGRVNVRQSGFATLYIAKYDETYTIPLPDVKIKGILTGTPYPELYGKYDIVSTSGFISTIDFTGEGFFGGNKHNFEAHLKKYDDTENEILYTVKGAWNSSFTIYDTQSGTDIETISVTDPSPTLPTSMIAPPNQDPWETQVAWKDVREALDQGNMQATVDAKSKIEKGQRVMRQDEKQASKVWKQLFFQNINKPDTPNANEEDDTYLSTVKTLFQRSVHASSKLELLLNRSVWRFNHVQWNQKFRDNDVSPPFHGDLRPDNISTRNGNIASSEQQLANDTQAGMEEPNGKSSEDTVHEPAGDQRIDAPAASNGVEVPEKERNVVENMLRDIYQSK